MLSGEESEDSTELLLVDAGFLCENGDVEAFGVWKEEVGYVGRGGDAQTHNFFVLYVAKGETGERASIRDISRLCDVDVRG